MTIPLPLRIWSQRWNVSEAALHELALVLGQPVTTAPDPGDASVVSESYAQSAVRLEAPHKGYQLFRNNVGVLTDETGRPVRYGLANDSKAMNRSIKSGDLIGWRRLLITPAMVGSIIAQFASREIKKPGWKLLPSDKRGEAQLAWANLVNANGGDAAFATGPGSFRE